MARPLRDSRPIPLGRHLVDMVRQSVPPVHLAGRPFVAGSLVVALLGYWWKPLRWVGLGLAAAMAFFFRHPARVAPIADGVIAAPADGVICAIDRAVPPPESGLGSTPRKRLSIFLSLFNVHVQRAPINATVLTVTHVPGRFVSADLPEASETNERTCMTVRLADGQTMAVVQVAGLVARRIICDASAGDQLQIGDPYGLIRFGSRVDMYLPDSASIDVVAGQRTIAGETMVAWL